MQFDGIRDNITSTASVAVSPPDGREDSTEGELQERKKSGIPGANGHGVSDFKPKVRSPRLYEKKKVDHADEKISDNSMTVTSDVVHGSVGDACDIDNASSVIEVEKEAVDESPFCPSVELDSKKNLVHEGLSSGISTEQKPPVAVNGEAVEGSGKDPVLSSGHDNILAPEDVDEFNAEKSDGLEVSSHVEQNESQRKEQASNIPVALGNPVGGVSSVADHKNERTEVISEKMEVLEHCSGGSSPYEESPPIPVQEIEQGMKSIGSKLTGVKAVETEEFTSTAEASLSVATGSDMAAKLDFDLNEGFPLDEGNQGEPVTSAVHLPSPLPYPVCSMSSGHPASITFAAAAKGPFVPPENPLRCKGELGWKGSAATSAFRPAEPRKVPEMPSSTIDIPSQDVTGSKRGRSPLDIDLNVPDERVLEDVASQTSVQETGSESGPVNNCDLGRGEMFGSSAPVRSAGGLDLDLNRVDEGTDIGQFSASTSCGLEVPLLPVRSSSSGGFPNGVVNILRDFDLNNGPGLDEVGMEQASRSQHPKSSPFLPSAAGLRMNSTELGSHSPWFSPGNSYPPVAIPSILPDREQPYSIVATSGAPRILGPPPGGTSFGPDVYRGSVLSSSPALAFSSATPFSYPGFPFSTSFPLHSTSFSGGPTTYIDSSPGGGLCFPAIPSQLVGPPGAVSSHYPRPYMMSLPDGSTNSGSESSRKWGRQGLDLNAGPVATDIEGRDERLPSVSRQLSVASSQAVVEEQVRMYQATGGMLKRKEPEGGWDSGRFNYKQPSWQ